jgi:hypothetical protein
LCKDHELAERLGRAGREGVHRHFSVAQEARRTLEVYGHHLKKIPAEPVEPAVSIARADLSR